MVINFSKNLNISDFVTIFLKGWLRKPKMMGFVAAVSEADKEVKKLNSKNQGAAIISDLK